MALHCRPSMPRAMIIAAALACLSGAAQGREAGHRHAHTALSAAAHAAESQRADARPPRLLVAIAVDQFSADLFAQYRQHYTGGLARLLTGAVFPSAYQSHAATETCPGHSTLLTGMHPARTGIISNSWYDLSLNRADKRVYCAEDEHDPNSTATDPVVSAGHLRVPTLGERMKAVWPESRNVAVSGKDRAVMMMGGHHIDAAYWWQGRGFSTFAGRDLGDDALDENGAMLKLFNAGAPGLAVPAWCGPLARDVTAGPVTLGTGRFAVRPQEADDIRISPRLDIATLDLAQRLVTTMKLGQGKAPDMLSISLSATDYVGHAYGTEGQEMCIQMQAMDAALGAFFARLDVMGLDYAVVLTADHGGLDVPERLDQQALPAAARVDKALTPPVLSYTIARKLGIDAKVAPCRPAAPAMPGAVPDPVADAPQLICGDGAFGDHYVTHDLPPALRGQVRAALVGILSGHPQVAAVFTREDLAAASVPHGNPQEWTLLDRARASWDAERSGDVVVLLKRAIVPIPQPATGYTATHGSAWDYDRRVPLLFWRKGLAGLEQPAPVETVDIAPTLAALIGLEVPAGTFDGRCLDIDGGPGDSCRSVASVPSAAHEQQR